MLRAPWVVAVCALAVFIAAPSSHAADLAVWAEQNAPRLALRDLDGREAALGNHRGRVVLVHFFATWCEPCRDELPALQRLSERIDAPSPVVLVISVGEPASRVRRFIESNQLRLRVLLDEDRAAAKAWRVDALPTTFVLDEAFAPRLMVDSDYRWDDMPLEALRAALKSAASNSQSKSNAITTGE